MKTRTAQAGGFTLIELLVVVAVIAILASLLFHGLSKASQSARSIKCKSNVRQMSLALQMYVGDHAAYPAGGASMQLERINWIGSLVPYLNDQSFIPKEGSPDAAVRRGALTVFRCPSVHAPPNYQVGENINYGYNLRGFANLGLGGRLESFGGQKRYSVVKENDVVVPSDMIAFGDGILRIKDWLTFGPVSLERNAPAFDPAVLDQIKDSDRRVRQRHGAKINVGFCDGHVETTKLQKMFYDESAEALRRWNRDHEPHPEALRQYR